MCACDWGEKSERRTRSVIASNVCRCRSSNAPPTSAQEKLLASNAYPERMTWLIWALFSALFAAATAILAKIGIAGIDSNLATAIRTTVVLVFTWAIAIALGKHNDMASISGRSWLFLALSGMATGLSWLCYFRALQLGPASAVAPIDKLSVVLVIVFAWLFLGESLTTPKIIGGLMIAGGAATLIFG